MAKKKMNSLSIIVLAIVAVLVILMAVQIGKKVAQGSKKGVPVVYTVGSISLKNEVIKQILSYQGIAEGDPQVKVYPSVTGKFKNNAVSEGQYVEDGQALVYIDRDIVGSDYMLAPVKAPISGTVTRLYYLDRGSAVAPDKPVAEVANIHNLKVVLNVGEDDLARVKPGQAAVITSVHDTNKFLPATVFSVTPFIDRDTLSGSISVKTPNTGSKLTIGMSVNVDITIGQKQAFMAPEEAIIMGLDKVYVFVNDNGKAKEVDVKLGYKQENRIEISSEDLHEGDQLITEGSFKLYDGAKINLIQK